MRNLPKTAFAVTIAGLALVLWAHISIAGEWHIETLNPDVVGDRPSMPSLALDSQGLPHMSYINLSPDYETQLRYIFWNGQEWQASVVDVLDEGYDSHIKLDSLDRPHISYCPGQSDIKYAYFDGELWIWEWVNPVLYSFYKSSLALDSQDSPRITFNSPDWDTGCTSLVYAYKQGSDWINQKVDDSSYSVGYGSCIALDAEDHPHISYYDDVNHTTKYAHWTGSEWEISLVDEAVSDSFYGTSIAIDQQGNPHISYCKNYNLCYAHWDGKGWDIQVVDDAQNTGYSSSLVIDSQGRPHISYAYYQSPNHYIKYAYFDGASWEIETLVKQCDYNDSWPINSLALNCADQPYIAFDEFINGQWSLNLAWQGDGFGLAVNLLCFTATAQEDSITLNWQVETTEGEQIAGFNLYRHNIVTESYSSPLQKQDADWTKVNPSLITGQNPYAYTDSAVEPGKTYEYRLEAVLADESTEILGTACCAPTPPAFAITKVYPNPASDVLNIALTLPQTGNVTLELYDLTGRVVASKDIQVISAGELSEQLDVGGLANGVYTLRATQMNLSASERVVVGR